MPQVAVISHYEREQFVLTNTRTEDEVISSITLDPRIPDPVEIAVSGDGGIVTLRGTVESLPSVARPSTTPARSTVSMRFTTRSRSTCSATAVETTTRSAESRFSC